MRSSTGDVSWKHLRLSRLRQQGGCCAICEEPVKKWRAAQRKHAGDKTAALDHNHETLQIRGVLCVQCNAGIGSLQDDPKLLRKAAEYLDQWATVVEKDYLRAERPIWGHRIPFSHRNQATSDEIDEFLGRVKP